MKIKSGLLLFFLLLHLLSFSRKSPVDSISNYLNRFPPDSGKVFRMIDLGAKYADMGDYSVAKQFGREAVDLSIKLGFEKGSAEAYYELGRTEYLAAEFPEAIGHYYKSCVLGN